jgi:DNA-binding response OmpR family regulator
MTTIAKPRILLVDDDEGIRGALAEFLEEEGYAVDVAVDGTDAMRHLETCPTLPAVIVLDVMMPHMDGATFRRAQAADQRFAKIPVIVATAMHLGAPELLTFVDCVRLRKPFEIDLMLSSIRDCVAR